jgi:hypothetical protein
MVAPFGADPSYQQLSHFRETGVSIPHPGQTRPLFAGVDASSDVRIGKNSGFEGFAGLPIFARRPGVMVRPR